MTIDPARAEPLRVMHSEARKAVKIGRGPATVIGRRLRQTTGSSFAGKVFRDRNRSVWFSRFSLSRGAVTKTESQDNCQAGKTLSLFARRSGGYPPRLFSRGFFIVQVK